MVASLRTERRIWPLVAPTQRSRARLRVRWETRIVKVLAITTPAANRAITAKASSPTVRISVSPLMSATRNQAWSSLVRAIAAPSSDAFRLATSYPGSCPTRPSAGSRRSPGWRSDP